jgi:hypothetical protein
MTDLRPGTAMYRIAELERVTRELRGLLELATERIAELEEQDPPEGSLDDRCRDYVTRWPGRDAPWPATA